MSGPAAASPVLLAVPGQGWWQARNSPARRVPSHGTDLFGSTFAIDLVGVDERGRSGPIGWRTLLATEDPRLFVGFGRVVTAPIAGLVEQVYEREPDGRVRRSPMAYPGFATSQPRRIRRGIAGLAGNCVVIALGPSGPYVLVAHLQLGSVSVRPGERVEAGEPIGRCGNSGNSTQPHVHLQVNDSLHWSTARGLPLAFADFQDRDGTVTRTGVPAEAQVVRRAA